MSNSRGRRISVKSHEEGLDQCLAHRKNLSHSFYFEKSSTPQKKVKEGIDFYKS